jgi:hypothetical protein
MRYETNQSVMSDSVHKITDTNPHPIPIPKIMKADSNSGLEMRIFDLESHFDKKIAYLEYEIKKA